MSALYETLSSRLSDRDWLILRSVDEYRYLLTRQIARLHFGLAANVKTIPRTANLALGRLRQLGLVRELDRRIGGVRAGSSGKVWQLTETANRLLAWRDSETRASRLRAIEPGVTFLEHTLAVAEVVLDLNDAAAAHDVAVSRVELEPAAWRPYLDRSGATVRLKPDLALVTTSGGYEDAWFLEVDRSTEPPGRIVRKCLQYQDYRHTGREQAQTGIFPAVVWVVPNLRRRDQLRARLREERRIDGRLFTVVTTTSLGELIALGAAEFSNRNGGFDAPA
ncbi:replication-relaxation family protein [Curtobacterium ammoniigenes]|uniref:replication-relaxation family protein n=1 Tax=Curtobacterium ammoniigenes TaxID=395387 RepID=UPI0009FAF18B|nr:replication-relaxation family protein [Curtobacterium ammoniigenes]